MKKQYWIAVILAGCFCQVRLNAMAQKNATITETEKEFTTYPFSDPNPIPNPTNVYPYFRFDGFTDKPVKKKWKVIELENDYIKLWIMPQIGGKIWTAIDKKHNRAFIYQNDVVKFRDIAMRGAWTSGGLEANFGIIGHTPGVANPVDYITKNNDDGSVSCTLSLLDLLTQTRWNLEVKLEKDKAYFTTRAFWHNKTGEDQPYYSWMNLAVKADDDLEFIEPGTNHLFHDGKSYEWPYDKEHNQNISFYKQNDFGGSQSYHITGVYSKYWGGYWQNGDYGMIHYAAREDRMGKKVFLWGKQRSGAIWDKLLNDNAGQYVELQSGRLYIQNMQESVYTPYKQYSFTPYQTDGWKEYWYPYNNTGGVAIADTSGVLNIKQGDGKATIYFSSVRSIKDTLKVIDKARRVVLNKPVSLEPLQNLQESLTLNNQQIDKIILGSCELNLSDSTKKVLSRPTKPLINVDYNSAYGLYLKGKYEEGTRYYAEAETNIRKSLRLNPSFIPSLTEMALLQFKKMDYQSAFDYARKALSLDSYDGMANYYYGLAAVKLGKVFDAEDGFEAATLTTEYRDAAFTELAEIKIRQQQYQEAYTYASKSLIYNAENVTALQLQYLAARLMNNSDMAAASETRINAIDPFNHFLPFEEYRKDRSEAAKTAFTSLIRDELPQQTYLDLAVWYNDLGLNDDCKLVLETAPQKDNEIEWWLAWLHRNEVDAAKWLDVAQKGNSYLVFPFRNESVPVMEWAIQNSPDWKPGYYLSLIYQSTHDRDKAKQAITESGNTSDYAPYYVYRARLCDSNDTKGRLDNLQTAVKLDPEGWRYRSALAEEFIKQGRKADALNTIEPFYKKHSSNYMIGMLYARCLMLNDRYSAAEKVLDQLHVLPYEGAKDGHKLYEQTKLMLALQLIKRGHLREASKKVEEARLWPEHLGVGAPYPDQIDNHPEDEIAELIKDSSTQKPSEKTLDDYFAKVKAINGM
jgi:predicted Zn-dependent protease